MDEKLLMQNLQRIILLQRMISQAIIFYLKDNLKDNEIYRERSYGIFALGIRNGAYAFNDNLDLLVNYIKNIGTEVDKIVDFYEKNEKFWVFPQYLSFKKSQNCRDFIIRFINKYSSFNIDILDNIFYKNKNVNDIEVLNQCRYEEFMNYIDKSIVNKINSKDKKNGDIILYKKKGENKIIHVGFVYDKKNGTSLSKSGFDFFYIWPEDTFYPTEFFEKIYVRVNDSQFQTNFESKLIPSIDAMKLNKKKLKKYIEKILKLKRD
jgi:hypothetical protein